jgi:hypothetical protein
MGNSIDVIRKVPEDLSKSSLRQLEEVIHQAIIHSPWNDVNDQQTPEEILSSTVLEMGRKGFRPITAPEYLSMLKDKDQGTISLWIPVEHSSGEEAMCITLPSCTEELSERAVAIEEQMKSCSDACLSELETVPWAASITYAE